jgi:YesN/AraC family two-component response regulator
MLNARIIYYIHLHYSEDITLASIAQDFYFNKNYLSELFGKSGASFTRLLHEIRIYHACSLLLTTDMQINDIGFQVGFNSTETFFRVFKKQRGVSPSEYRKIGAV